MAKRLKISRGILVKRVILLAVTGFAVLGAVRLWGMFHDGDFGMLLGQQSGSQPAKPANILLLGVDKEGYRTDTIMLAGIDPASGRASVMQIPRDTYVINKRRDKKINSAYFSGFPVLASELESVCGIKPDKYIAVDFEGLRKIVDEIGGVEVDVPINMKYDDPAQNLHINLKKGVQVLDGKKAEQFVRFRKNNDGTGYPEGDLGRIKAQKEFMRAVLNKALSGSNIFKASKLLDVATKYTKSNVSRGDMLKYITAALSLKAENVQFLTLPGESKYFGHGWYFVADKAKARELAKEYFTYEVAASTPEAVKVFGRGIKVEVLNGSGSEGMEQTYKQILGDMGFDVVKAGTLGSMTYAKSVVIERKPGAGGSLAAEAIGGADVSKDYNAASSAQLTVIIGMDKND